MESILLNDRSSARLERSNLVPRARARFRPAVVIANMASCLALLVTKKYSNMNIMVIPKEMSIEAVITHNDRTTQCMRNVNYAYYTRALALLVEFYHLSFYRLQIK